MFNLRINPDRRRWKRHWINAPIRISTDHVAVDGLAIKMSAGGIYFFAIADMSPGTHVDMEFCPPPSKEKVRISGTIRSRAVYLYGVEFVRQPAWTT